MRNNWYNKDKVHDPQIKRAEERWQRAKQAGLKLPWEERLSNSQKENTDESPKTTGG